MTARQLIGTILIIIASTIILVMIIIAIIFVRWSKIPEPSPYTVKSTTYRTPSTRINELKRHWPRIKSPVQDTVYDIIITPHKMGPSVSEFTIGLKVDPKDIDNWLNDYSPYEGGDYNYIRDFEVISIPWQHISKPEYYYGSTGDHVIVFRKEGVILIHGID